ncbi:uncharacterized protein LOC105187110 isoform X3 [Harpegnathos saltator]|uniref:uncharacterized protein LOC105187110 isoform X3 n=1 Tax=Harpegnathos saltator TaxID=610380 RepID=UPI000DBEF0B2|nr:uncharacterized protein LOC105187110 isoform X3 [Harpegnathos saltator]
MLSDIMKCFLAILFSCAFYTNSDAHAINNAGNNGAFNSASASTYTGAIASANAGTSMLSGANPFIGTFAGTGNFPRTHEGHKEIHSYDNTNFPYDSNANRDIKSVGHHRGTKNGAHDYNKNSDSCSRCKWENNDYWEQDEPEKEGDENDGDECDDGDDGQYRPDKTYYHGSGSRKHTSGSHPPGVHKTGPTGVYGDNVKEEVKENKPDSPFGTINFPTNTGYVGLTNGHRSISKPGSNWNIPFTSTSKPGYSGLNTGTFTTTPSNEPTTNWNRRTTLAGFGSTPKPTWNNVHGDTFSGSFGTTSNPTWNIKFSSAPTTEFPLQKSNWNAGYDNTFAESYGTTLKSGISSNVGTDAIVDESSISQQPGAAWNDKYNNKPIENYRTTLKPEQGWNTGFASTPIAGFLFSQKPVQNWGTDHGNTPIGSFGTVPKSGSSWNTGSSGPTAEFPSSQKPVVLWNIRHDNMPVRSFETAMKSEQDRNTGFDSTLGSSWNPNQKTTFVGTSGCTRPDSNYSQGKQGPIKVNTTLFNSGLTKNDGFPSDTSQRTSHRGSDTLHSSSSSENQIGPYRQYGVTGNAPDYSQPENKLHIMSSSSVASTFGLNKNPQGGFGSFGIVSGTHEGPNPNDGTRTIATNSWSNTGHTESKSNTWPFLHTTPHTGFHVINTMFGTTRTPFDYVNTSGSSDGLYRPKGPKPIGFDVASSNITTNANTNAFDTSFGRYNIPGITQTFIHSTPSVNTKSSSYSAVKSSTEITRPTYGLGSHNTQSNSGTGIWSNKQPGDERGTWLGKQPENGVEIKSDTQLSNGSALWPGKQPFTFEGYSRSGVETWPYRQSEDGSAIMPSRYPESNSGTWSGIKPGSGITLGDHSAIGTSPGRHPTDVNSNWFTQKPRIGTWQDGQIEHESRSRCMSGNCAPTGAFSGSSNCGRIYDCSNGCKGNNNVSMKHGSCNEVINGPSGVNKTYYPAGINNHVPNIANIYGPSSSSTISNGIPTEVNTGCKSEDNSCNQGNTGVTPRGLIQWNSANPFLYGSVGFQVMFHDLGVKLHLNQLAKEIRSWTPVGVVLSLTAIMQTMIKI